MKTKIAILEMAMFLGICAAALVVPRSFPLMRFIEISIGVLVAANVMLLSALRKRRTNPSSNFRMGSQAYLALTLIVFYWLLVFLLR